MEERELIRLRPGERHVVTLPGMGAAGFRWSFEIAGDADAVEVVPSAPDRRDAADPAPGASVDESFVLEGRSPGRATIRFSQTRPWEAAGSPLAQRVLDVEVDEAQESGPRPA